MTALQRWMTALAVCLAPLATATAGGNADKPALQPFEAVYSAQWNNIRLGEIHIGLRRDGEFCYVYTSEARPVRLVRAFYGTPAEESYFCLVDGAVRPVRFAFDHGDDSFTLDFDWVNGVVTGDGTAEAERELPENAQDRLGMQQAVRAWVLAKLPDAPEGDYVFNMVEDDRIREYTLRMTGTEQVRTPAGRFDAHKLERVDPDRIARFWVAPEAQAMPVKVETGRDGRVQLSMELKRFESRSD